MNVASSFSALCADVYPVDIFALHKEQNIRVWTSKFFHYVDVGIHFFSTACRPDERYFLCFISLFHAVYHVLRVQYSFRKKGFDYLSQKAQYNLISHIRCHCLYRHPVLFPAGIQVVHRMDSSIRFMSWKDTCCHFKWYSSFSLIEFSVQAH